MESNKEKYIPCGEKNSVKAVSRRILQMDGNTLTLILGFIVCAILYISPMVIAWAITYLAPEESLFFVMLRLLAMLIMLCGVVMVSLPCAAGYATLARDIVNGKKPSLLCFFSVFTDKKRYPRAILYALILMAYLAAAALVFAGGFAQLDASLIAITDADFFKMLALFAFWLCAFIAAALVFAYFSSYMFFVPYGYLEGKKFKDAVKESVAASGKCRAQIIKLEFSYLGHLLVGFLSLGVLLVIRSAPMISVSYVVFCNRIFEKDVFGE